MDKKLYIRANKTFQMSCVVATSTFGGLRPSVPVRGRSVSRTVQPRALFGGPKKTEEQSQDVVDGMDGFMFDPSMQRWIRAPGRKVTKEALTVKPFSGAS